MPKRPNFQDVSGATGNDEGTKQQENPVEGYIPSLADKIG
jgi:hypothetical protein